jgi:EAL domain-containing protein (putative c-di-GMP-specific phosphodiesterase class I)
VVGVEALVRWNHPDRGLIPPIEFVGLAEESGLILPMGNWVLTQACRQAAEWRRSRGDLPPVTVSVNVSAKQVHHGSLYKVVQQVLRDTDLEAGLLKLELTESVLMEEVEGLHETLDRITAQGVHLALDDFGTGYSALGYLHRFPIQTLKVDRSFVAGIGIDAKRSAIVQAVIDMARALGIDVVAEGVETATQAALLFELGCKYAQGFYFAKPAPVEQVVALLGPDVLPLGSTASASANGNGKRPSRRAGARRRSTAIAGATPSSG